MDESSFSLRVLVVDDDVDMTASSSLLLKLWGHEVRVAHNGDAALIAASDYRPDVILLDVGLRDCMNGFEVARLLRKLSGLEDVVLICMTGWGANEDRQLAHEAGFDHFLVKPADPRMLEVLLAAVKERLSERKSRRDLDGPSLP